jgi:hypothetical protein
VNVGNGDYLEILERGIPIFNRNRSAIDDEAMRLDDIRLGETGDCSRKNQKCRERRF